MAYIQQETSSTSGHDGKTGLEIGRGCFYNGA
jgi:hypothetical protein